MSDLPHTCDALEECPTPLAWLCKCGKYVPEPGDDSRFMSHIRNYRGENIKHGHKQLLSVETGAELATSRKEAVKEGYLEIDPGGRPPKDKKANDQGDSATTIGEKLTHGPTDQGAVEVRWWQDEIRLDYEWVDAFEKALTLQAQGQLDTDFGGYTPEDFGLFAKWVLRHFKATTPFNWNEGIAGNIADLFNHSEGENDDGQGKSQEQFQQQ